MGTLHFCKGLSPLCFYNQTWHDHHSWCVLHCWLYLWWDTGREPQMRVQYNWCNDISQSPPPSVSANKLAWPSLKFAEAGKNLKWRKSLQCIDLTWKGFYLYFNYKTGVFPLNKIFSTEQHIKCPKYHKGFPLLASEYGQYPIYLYTYVHIYNSHTKIYTPPLIANKT